MLHLLDTATLANNALTPQVLPERIRRLLDTDEVKGLCGVSLLELAIHHRRGRLKLKGTLDDFFASSLASDIEVLDLTPAIAVATNDLPDDFPGDPFDRTIAATAHVLNLTLITPDPEIRDSGFCRVEFYPFKPSRA
jgi:PIN domain nuclease of toxin-antitoxin system